MHIRTPFATAALAAAALLSGLSAQTLSFAPAAAFASSEVELDGLTQAAAFPNPATANAILYNTNYGTVTTGNTISRANFIATMGAAFTGGFGGVYGFEDVASGSTGTQLNFITASAGTVSVTGGTNHYVEGGSNENYRGKETGLFDGTGPSPLGNLGTNPVPAAFDVGTSSSKVEIGVNILQGTTSFDLNFDITDQVSVIGFAHMNYNNFQSFQRGNSDYANIHARATWSDGLTTVTEQAIQFSAQNNSNDVYFGFQQPGSGFFLDRLELYQISNAARAFIAIDEMGIAVGDGVAVPEPSTYAMFAGALALGLAMLRRRR
jgi:hypothetical protein